MQIMVMAVMTRRISAATGTAAATRMVSFMLSNSTRKDVCKWEGWVWFDIDKTCYNQR